jgi:hypothetical protein
MSEMQTAKWKGAAEQRVLENLGDYKKKKAQTDGYSLLFDYSTTTVGKLVNRNVNTPTMQVTQRDARGNPVLVNRTSPAPAVPIPGYSTSQYTRYMEFFFDKEGRVTYVYAEGYPDSVAYVKRR